MEEEVKNNEGRRTRREYRDSDSRAANERPPLAWGMGSQFNYDQSVIDDTRYQFGWVPYIVANEEVTIPYDNALKKFWEPAPASEYTQMRRIYKKDPFGRGRDTDDDIVRRGGLIAMRRAKEYEKAEEDWFNEENNHNEKVIQNYQSTTPGDLQLMSHSRVKGRPIF